MTRIVVKSHYSAAELAGMALPDVPRSSSGIFRAARAGAWMARKREGRGGGLEYALDSLPADAQAEIRRLASAALVASVPVQPTKAVIRREQQLQLVETDVQRLRADARKGIL
ncbi:DNA-binding protein, partial [Burkholderia cenocepacia]|uniref:DNA-binding protein n=1 Tax=Burkholderia cenocepacia TaxID=95486 RepID=UPI002AB62E65